MRPVQLRIEGFTCFKKEQVVDFDGLDLFAISGPTGAGKSSLLDTMVYALYGCVPRVGKRGYKEFISLGSNRMSVLFAFRLGDHSYRVTRTAKRQGAPGAQIEEITANGETLRPLADGIADVDRTVQEIVGLDYDGFIQAVVLPQGEFAKFLQSPPGNRTTLLRDLLRLGRYEDMRKNAQARSTAAEVEAIHIDKRLAEDYSGATASEVKKLEEIVAHESKNIVHLRRQLEAAEAEAKKARRLRERTAELEAKGAERDALALKRNQVSAMEHSLEASARAAKVIPALDQLLEAEVRAKKAVSESEAAGMAAQRALEAEKRALAIAERAAQAAKRLPDIAKQVQRITEIIGLLEPRDRLEQSARGLQKTALEHQRRIADLEQQRQAGAATLAKEEKDLLVVEREVKRIGYDARFHEKLEATLDEASDLKHQGESLEELREAAAEASAEARSSKKKAQEAAVRVEAGSRTSERLVRTAEESEATVVEAERLHAAHRLRGDLHRGKPCPVCEQPVVVLPKSRRVGSKLDELRRVAQEARRRATDAQQKQAARQADARTSARAATAAQGKATSAADEVTAKAAKYTAATARLVAWCGRAQIVVIEPVETQIISLDAALRAKRKQHDKAVRSVTEATGARDQARTSLDRVDAQLIAVRERRARNEEQLSDIRKQLDEYDRKIRAVVGEDDPREERVVLQKEHLELEQAHNNARGVAQEASTRVTQTRALLSAAKSQQEECAKHLSDRQAKARVGLAQAGFQTPASARAALLEDKTVQQKNREIRDYHQKTVMVSERLAELEKDLGTQRLSQHDLEKTERARTEAADSVERTVAALHVTEEQLQQLTERLARARDLGAQLKAHREVARVYGALADELQSNRFQQYLLEETFGSLVAAASTRLKKISDRYALAQEGGAFFVIDQDNASEQRSTDTLSGGETFLTSLALALELSAQVQHAAGALQLESIFIDEGFGTLDPDTLETVAAAIEALPVGGRMVGIITHIAELTERLPGRIAIEKAAGGSQVHVTR